MHQLINLTALGTLAVGTTSCQQAGHVTPLSGKDVAGTAATGTEITVTPQFQRRFIAPKIGRGDYDFGGNGPNVTFRAILVRSGNNLVEQITFHAKETKADWTEVGGPPREMVVYSGNRRILGFGQGQYIGASASFEDTRNSDNVFTSSDPNQPIQEIRIVGDTGKREAGVSTGVKSILYRPVRIIVE